LAAKVWAAKVWAAKAWAAKGWAAKGLVSGVVDVLGGCTSVPRFSAAFSQAAD
jgi:hypothetical protein